MRNERKLDNIAPMVAAALIANAGTILNNVEDFISGIFGGGPSRWTNSGPGVHDFVTKYVDNKFLGWLDNNAPNALQSIDAIKAIAPAAYIKLGLEPTFIHPYDNMYDAKVTPKAYEEMGVDYLATWNKWKGKFGTGEPGDDINNWIPISKTGSQSESASTDNNGSNNRGTATAGFGGSWLLLGLVLLISAPMIIGLVKGKNGSSSK